MITVPLLPCMRCQPDADEGAVYVANAVRLYVPVALLTMCSLFDVQLACLSPRGPVWAR